MIIDAHQHLVTGSQLGQYQAFLLNGRGFHGKGHPGVTAETVANWRNAGKRHTELLDEVGTDMAFISPRPYSLMHSEKPNKIVHWFCEANNN
ncbi:MAG: amidohydrolase, partial [Chloroflexi bacterium]|nr:amidohydrolase [Chloroflexota bacterium]